MKLRPLVRLILLLTILTCAVYGACAAESFSANTMRLLRYEGTVEIEDAAGKPRFIMENARFHSGESMRTGAALSSPRPCSRPKRRSPASAFSRPAP